MTTLIPAFLDIDGVLQSAASVLAGTAMAHAHDLSTIQQLAETQATKLLLRIQERHAQNIQWWIASSWCNGNSPEQLQQAFETIGFKNVRCCTSGTRVGRIREVLATLAPEQIERAIVIDDNQSAFLNTELEARWVKIESHNGFDAEAYYTVLHLLNIEKPEVFFW